MTWKRPEDQPEPYVYANILVSRPRGFKLDWRITVAVIVVLAAIYILYWS